MNTISLFFPNITSILFFKDVAEFLEYIQNKSTIPDQTQTSQKLEQTPPQPQTSSSSLTQITTASQPQTIPYQTTADNSTLDTSINNSTAAESQIKISTSTSLPLQNRLNVSFTDEENRFLLEQYNEHMDEIGPKEECEAIAARDDSISQKSSVELVT